MTQNFKSQFAKMLITSLAVMAFAACNQNKDESKPTPQPQATPASQTPATPAAGASSTSAAVSAAPITRAVMFAHDGLVEAMTKELDAVQDAEQKKKNDSAAAGIISIESKINSKDSSIKVKVVMKAQGKKKSSEETLVGAVLGRSRKITLTSKDKNGVLKGTMTCLDADFPSYCTTARIELNAKNEKNPVKVLALIRRTEATFTLPEQDLIENGSDEYNALLNIFLNESDKSVKTDSVSKIQVISTEIIKGRTNAQINLITEGKQVIALNGELKQVVNSNIVEGELSKAITPASISDLISANEIKQDLQAKIQSASVIEVINRSTLSLVLNAKGIVKNERQAIKVLIDRVYPGLSQQ